eukprot:4665254-Ditylum_brightwellii.AAC.1
MFAHANKNIAHKKKAEKFFFTSFIQSDVKNNAYENAALLPEEGNLIHLPGVLIVHEVNIAGKEVIQ